MTSPMTDERLDEIEARAEKATLGIWGANVGSGDEYEVLALGSFPKEVCRVYSPCLDEDCEEDVQWTNMEFIAAARSDVPDLVAEIRRLRRLIEDYDAALKKLNVRTGPHKFSLVDDITCDDCEEPMEGDVWEYALDGYVCGTCEEKREAQHGND